MLVSIITVGMNHISYIKKLYKSLFEDFPPTVSFEAIYVDNCSSDGSVEFIRDNYPLVRIVENQIVKGFGDNNNIGVQQAIGEYVAIINPDIIMQKNSIDALFFFMRNNLNIGIVVPQLLNDDLSIQYSVRGFISLKMLLCRFLTKGNDNVRWKTIDRYLRKDLDIELTQPVDWAIGAAMFISKNFYLELGGFDKNYFLYMEDQDICLRSWKLKRPIIYLPEAKMIHNHLRGSSKLGKKTLLHIKSMVIFFMKHGANIKSFCNN